MISLIQVPEGPVDIYELRAKYLGKLKTTESVMLPTFLFNDKEFFITDLTPAPNDMWTLTLSNEEGAVKWLRIKNGEMISNGSKLMLSDAMKVYSPNKYYDYWIIDGRKPSPFFYEGIKYYVKAFMRIPGSTDLYITAEREKGRWFTFRLGDDLRSKFTRHLMTNEKGHQTYEWLLENADRTIEQHRYF